MDDPRRINRRLIHKGAKFDFEQLEWEAGGRVIRREIVRHPGAVVVVPVLEDGSVVFVRNFRPAAGRRLLELPAGTLEAGEAPDACAARELAEETGYRAATLRPLSRFYTSPGLSDELMYAFVASGLTEAGQNLQEDEDLEVELTPSDRAMELVRSGELLDGKSILALLLAEREGLLRGQGATG